MVKVDVKVGNKHLGMEGVYNYEYVNKHIITQQ
jgi:hypothetical protein